jgi:GTP cyclohydrolase I
METLFKNLLQEIGEDPSREGLVRTPKRAAEAYRYMTRGYKQDVKEIMNGAVFTATSDEMILVKDIEMYSLCEHHLLPFIGKCHVAYIPREKIIGLSKIPRIVEMFARRLQVQENLTSQIAHTLQEAIDAAGVAVVIEAQHLCMMMRGVEKQNAVMKTSCMLGYFRQSINTRAEFLSLIK